MKRTAFALLGILTLAACSGNSYSVKGEAEGLAEGETVYLCNIRNGVSLEKSDSVVSKGGKFAFKGTTDTCEVAVITFDMNGAEVTCTFFLEPGNIRVDFDGQYQHVSGTPTNNGFQVFIDQVDEIDRLASEIDLRMRKADSEGRNTDSIKEEMNDLQERYMELCFNSVKDNADNLFGYQQLLDCYSMFEPVQLDELLNAVEPYFVGKQPIAQLRQIVNLQLKTSVGNQYQDFTAKIMKGSDFADARLSDYVDKSKAVLLYFWASWCAPCLNDYPFLKEAYGKFHGKGLEIVFVSVDEDQAEWRKAVSDNALSWPQFLDTEAVTSPESPASLYAINTIPASYIIDSDGTIIAHNLRGQEFVDALSDYFK